MPATRRWKDLPVAVETGGTTRSNRAQRAVLRFVAAEELSQAAASVLATVPEWWRRRAKELGIHGGALCDVTQAIDTQPPIAVELLAELPIREDLLDSGPEALSDAYVVALDDRVRIADGRHYTPAPLADEMYRRAV